MALWRGVKIALLLVPVIFCAGAFGQGAPAPDVKLADACRIRVVKGLLTVDTDVDANSRIIDFAGQCDIRFTRDANNHVDSYELTLVPKTEDMVVRDIISFARDQLEFTRYETGGTADQTMTIMQRTGFMNGRPAGFQPPLSLMINTPMGGRGWGGRGGRGGAGNRANTFDDLIKAYPQETEQFLRPMLRDLHNEYLLPPANLAALQILAPEIPPDPNKAARIAELVKQLNADASDDRESASAQLKAMQGDAMVALRSLDRKNLSPEQTDRIDAICENFKPMTDDEIKAGRQDVRFLLSAMASDEQPIRDAALKVLQQATSKQIPFNTGGNPVERSRALTALHNQLLPSVAN